MIGREELRIVSKLTPTAAHTDTMQFTIISWDKNNALKDLVQESFKTSKNKYNKKDMTKTNELCL